MRRSRKSVARGRVPLALLGCLLGLALATAAAAPRGEGLPAVAFWYGHDPPLDELALYDWVVLEPEHLPDGPPGRLTAAGVLPFAYVSVGEVGRHRSWAGEVDPAWVLGRNRAWDSRVMDLASPGWRAFLLERRFAPLWERGWRAFFLDTLDSYQGVLPGGRWPAQVEGLAELIGTLRARFPGVRLLLNRGFELLPRLEAEGAGAVVGVAAESLQAGWDPATGRYAPVPEAERGWLLERLERVRRLGLTGVAIDYLPPGRREEARRVARRIAAQGLVPWVADPALLTLGVGLLEVVPRKVLVLYDAPPERLPYVEAHRLLGLPLEHLGLVPVYRSVTEGLPKGPLAGRYAGVVAWFQRPLRRPGPFQRWLEERLEERVPVVFFARLGFRPGPRLLERLGVALEERLPGPGLRILRQAPGMGFDARPVPRPDLGPYRADSPEVEPWLRLGDRDGGVWDPVAVAPWGGWALDPTCWLPTAPWGIPRRPWSAGCPIPSPSSGPPCTCPPCRCRTSPPRTAAGCSRCTSTATASTTVPNSPAIPTRPR